MMKSAQHHQQKEQEEAKIKKKKKKLRSKFPVRRARAHFTPILVFNVNKSHILADDSLSSLLQEASCDSSRVSLIANPNINNNSLSESSCCIHSSKTFNINDQLSADFANQNDHVVSEGLTSKKKKNKKNNKRKLSNVDVNSIVEEYQQCSDNVSFSSVTIRSFNSKKRSFTDVDADISFTSAVDNFSNELSEQHYEGNSFVSANSPEDKGVSNKSSVFEFDSEVYCDESLKFESDDLACTEHLLADVSASVQSSSHETLYTAELPTDLLFNSDDYFSDFSDSLFTDSGSDFSQGSVDDSAPSLTFSLFLKFRQQFITSSCPSTVELKAIVEDDFTSVRFKDEEDEDSYQLLRKRERRQVFLRDYTTEYGDLVFKQRSDMVSWIVEQSTAKEYHKETVFLGVSLLDRFLSKGFFDIEKNFQIVGIACLTLATRIEENQPYNSVRQKNFHIGSTAYSRSEVVAMEWLVMEVLEFKCFLPTIHNFLWFYLRAAKADAETEKRVKYLAVLVLLNPTQLCYWPSTVAAGLVILASLEGYQGASYHRVIEAHVRTKNDDLPECIKSMEWLLQYL